MDGGKAHKKHKKSHKLKRGPPAAEAARNSESDGVRGNDEEEEARATPVAVESKKARVEASEDNAPGEASDDDGGAGGETGANGETGAVDSNPLKMTRFAELPINDKLKSRLSETFKFEKMTEIQEKCIPPLLAGKNVLGEGKTGSGKTLAFLVPCIEMLLRTEFKPRNGTGIIIITPTRELAMQIFGVVRDLMQDNMTQTFGVIMGGANRKGEQEKLGKGVNLLVCTPGRLLDHLQSTAEFNVKNLQALVIDEADRILQHGFEDEMRTILRLLPRKRQTMLFSATQTQDVKQLARLSFTDRPLFISVKGNQESEMATVQGLQQGYIVCPSEMRFLLLFTFLKKNMGKKMMVFMSSCASVKFFDELLNYIDIPVLSIHGKQKQTKRTATFFEFCNAEKGILVCTDVAARGLDIPAVDWIIQYDPPDDTAEYIHRVGRTARAGGSGKALLFLLETELAYLKHLKAAGVPLNEYSVPKEKIANIQSQLERLMEKNYYLYQSARDAYRGYVLSYQSHKLKECYDVFKLDLQRIAKSFGFSAPPKINLGVKPNPDGSVMKGSSSTEARKSGRGSGDSAVRRHSGKADARQWTK